MHSSRLALPTFLTIGAQKCGTTWLSKMLVQHPEVMIPAEKELHFFDKTARYARGLEWYCEQFSSDQPVVARGELTPNYFWTLGDDEKPEFGQDAQLIPQLVADALPDVQLILMLRDPVARAISAFYHHIRHGPVSPDDSILDVSDRLGIESMGRYDVHLARWLEHFPKHRILVLIYEDDLTDAAKPETLRRVFRHIGVSEDFEPEHLYTRYNGTGLHFRMRVANSPFAILSRERIVRHLPGWLTGMERWKVRVTHHEITELQRRFEPHVLRLETLLGRRMESWRELAERRQESSVTEGPEALTQTIS